jgi:anti-sigma factor ChrR (cupin superfamily)
MTDRHRKVAEVQRQLFALHRERIDAITAMMAQQQKLDEMERKEDELLDEAEGLIEPVDEEAAMRDAVLALSDDQIRTLPVDKAAVLLTIKSKMTATM